jgi:hypothetical protein
LPQNLHNETHSTLLSKEYYDIHKIQNDEKYCQHERYYEVEQQSMEKSDRTGHFQKKGLKDMTMLKHNF